jgi:hypothetical protein
MFIFSSVAVAFTTCRLVSLRFSAATESPYLERERDLCIFVDVSIRGRSIAFFTHDFVTIFFIQPFALQKSTVRSQTYVLIYFLVFCNYIYQ